MLYSRVSEYSERITILRRAVTLLFFLFRFVHTDASPCRQRRHSRQCEIVPALNRFDSAGLYGLPLADVQGFPSERDRDKKAGEKRIAVSGTVCTLLDSIKSLDPTI